MKLSFLLICLGGLLGATTFSSSRDLLRRSSSELYQNARAGKLRNSLYAKIVAPVSVALIVAGLYMALTWR